jgi:rhodanese-related sulfurtransferase
LVVAGGRYADAMSASSEHTGGMAPTASATGAARSGDGPTDGDGPRPGAAPSGLAVDPAEVTIDPAQVADWLAGDPELQLVDVRETYERDAGHIAGSRHIELAELPTRAGELAPERPVVFYCRVGRRSDMAALAFRASGLRAHSMRGGLERWARENRPLVPKDGHVADH